MPLTAAEKTARYRAKHPDRVKASTQRWRQANAEKVAANTAAWRDRNTEKVREMNRLAARRWRERHPTKARSKSRNWKRANPGNQQNLNRLRRARQLGAEGSCSPLQLEARFLMYGNCCAYCGAEGELHVDHVIPLSRGGTNWPANLRPACPSCNRRKGNKLLSEWSGATTGE